MPKKTYGTKRSAVAPGAAAIFGEAAAASRSPLSEVTSAINNLSLCEEEDEEEEEEEEEDEEEDEEEGEEADDIEQSSLTQPYPSLLPLVTAYKTDIKKPLIIQDWNDILNDDADLTKIAEASYAEVYRVHTAAGSSILKVMQVKVPELRDSPTSETALDVNTLVGEIRIMNALTTVPGFVTFKDSYLFNGLTPACIKRAYREHSEELNKEGNYNFFPDPDTYPEDTLFLAIELGDAGHVLDECEINTVDQFWDVFLGTLIALARAEVTNEFEHRDLHENNICIKFDLDIPPRPEPTSDSPLKYGFSGWEVTIIDYGISRAKLANGEIAFNDLEQDLNIFHGQANGLAGQQYDTYRRMRAHLLTGTRTMHPKSWHTPTSFTENNTQNNTWSTFMPYTNILWLRYLLSCLLRKLKKNTPSKSQLIKDLEEEFKELRRRLDTRTKVENGAFSSAQEALAWVFERGWVGDEQLVGEDGTSFLSGD